MLLNHHALFTGCAAALVTPFLKDSFLDEPALRRLLTMQKDAGMDAIVLLGTTGEPSTLTMAERERIISIGVEMLGKQMPVIVGTGSNDTRRAVEYAKQAKRLGAAGQLCVTPYYNKSTQAGLLRHYNAILSACDLPMIVYNVPSRTGMSISEQTAAALADHPMIAGIKEASGDLSLAAHIQQRTEGKLSIYCGNDDLILPLMAIGAQGAISVCANVVPSKTRALTTACLNGCFDEAQQMQQELLPLIDALFTQVNPIPVKAALYRMGVICDELRLPLTPLEEPHRARLYDILKRMQLLENDVTA